MKKFSLNSQMTDADLRRSLQRLLTNSSVSVKQPFVLKTLRFISAHQKDTLTYGLEAST